MLFDSPAVNATGPKATRIELFSFSTPQMRAFHISWMAFFVCFFAWFAAAPLMPLIKKEFGLSMAQVDNIAIASVSITILVRLIIGPLCDRFGPRRAYTGLLLIGSLPVFGLAFAQTYESFLFFRLLIGSIGASFVITQYHTSVMFAPNVVGTANATAGGLGNAGGGFAQSVMPLLLAALVSLGIEHSYGWRVAMFVPAVAMVIMGFVYARYTQDTPQGDIVDLRKQGINVDTGKKGGWAVFLKASGNYRTWMLALAYAATFGVELFVQTIATIYYVDHFHLSLEEAGLAVGIFGGLALFARALGGFISDHVAGRWGLDGRKLVLFICLLGDGAGLLMFSQAATVTLAVLTMTLLGLFTNMGAGSTYALTPFVDRKAIGGVAGIIGAGGNIGGVIAGLLNKASPSIEHTFFLLGWLVLATSVCALVIRFSDEHKATERRLYEEALAQRRLLASE